jgi:ribonuclease-3
MPQHRNPELLAALQRRIGYDFTDPGLLQRALTHRSAESEHMERLEFLGDAVLGVVIAEALHDRFSEAAEGELSRMRAALVRREALLTVSDAWQLVPCLRVGEGERTPGGIKSPSIAANAVEAVIGAVFKDAGWEAVRNLVLESWQGMLAEADRIEVRDAKSRLQEYTQGCGWGVPEYRVSDLGIGAIPRFEARCLVRGELLGQGTGERKKTAEINAAEQAWNKLNKANL